jgi:hypothetical protein
MSKQDEAEGKATIEDLQAEIQELKQLIINQQGKSS